MKTLLSAIAIIIVIGMYFTGCSDSSDPLAPVDKVSSLNTGGSLDKPVLHSATGNAHWKIDPLTGDTTNIFWSFNAVMHIDGSVTGHLNGGGDFGATVYDLKVSSNIAKFSVNFVRGDLGNSYSPPVDISEIYGWLIVIDNGEGSNATGPDSSSILLFTDGSDIGYETIVGIDNMEPREFLDWMHDYLLPLYGVPYEAYLAPTDNGNIQVR
jgi:hypothetical protein